MARKLASAAYRLRHDDAVLDVIAGVWLVTLLMGLLNLPTLLSISATFT